MTARLRGWSSTQTRVTHYCSTDGVRFVSYCGAPIRFTTLDGFAKPTAKRLRGTEICDNCNRIVWTRRK